MPSTLCRIVLTVVSCVVDPSTPAPTPKDAVAILTASLGPGYVPTPLPPFEPGWWVDAPLNLPPSDRDWPFTGSFAPTWFPTDRWLDGTPRVDPLLYGNPWFGGTPYGSGLYGGGLVPFGRPGGRANRPSDRTPPAVPRVVDRSPRPPVRAPLAAPSASVRTKVGKN
jgi:hypothetical protein